jgi:hypothetical protein
VLDLTAQRMRRRAASACPRKSPHYPDADLLWFDDLVSRAKPHTSLKKTASIAAPEYRRDPVRRIGPMRVSRGLPSHPVLN